MVSGHASDSEKSLTRVYLQEACLRHQFIRSKDTSTVVERPQRLRAINIGVAALLARLEALRGSNGVMTEDDELIRAMDEINISNQRPTDIRVPLEVVRSTASLDLLRHPAVKFVHGDIGGDVYLESLIKWSKESRQKIADEGCELPEGMPRGDLYLCPTSVDAVQGALGTVCEAVDYIFSPNSTSSQAFVAVRPPGHHCGENTPSGFCFVNNVVVAAAHAHLQYNIHRAVILDIDLHHGNGTQSLIWDINEEAYRQQQEDMFRLPLPGAAQHSKPSLQAFYGSLHDVLSYPCEDGKAALVQAASVSIHGPHGQYIENVHLLPYTSKDEFWNELYENRYHTLFDKAATFLKKTAKGDSSDMIVFISCGFDASEHEHASMSRHGRHVPTSFYRRFARDALAFAEEHAQGRLISVLEGGYSDRALTSGVMAWLAGLTEGPSRQSAQDVGVKAPVTHVDEGREQIHESWWNMESLIALEKATKKRRGGHSAAPNATIPSWLQRTLEIFSSIDMSLPRSNSSTAPVPRLRMALRDRTKKVDMKQEPLASDLTCTSSSESSEEDEASAKGAPRESTWVPSPTKKVPKVILKLGPPPTA